MLSCGCHMSWDSYRKKHYGICSWHNIMINMSCDFSKNRNVEWGCSLVSPSHSNTSSTLLYIYPLIISWWLDSEHSAVTLPTLWQDYQHAAGKNSVVWLCGFSNFENPHSTQRQDCEHCSESTNDDSGNGTTFKLVNFCSSQVIILALSSIWPMLPNDMQHAKTNT